VKTTIGLVYVAILIYGLILPSHLSCDTFPPEPDSKQLLSGKPFIYKLRPQRPEGRGYKLIYVVDAPRDIFWKFKTDFDNDFLTTNAYIDLHRFVSRRKNIVITENAYSNKTGTTFRWQTTVKPDQYRLEFLLMNPEKCGQKYHYGYIQLDDMDHKTMVTQVAYFDFFGAFFWVNYPFYGGMSDFLKYTASWEQQVILKLMDTYMNNN
jgi:hypothetical protein